VADLVLVRRMMPQVQFALGCLCISFTYASCSSASVIEGRYRLPESDVREITALVMQRSDIPKPILRIITSDPNHAWLETGRETPGALYSSFDVAKRHGQWRVDSDVETMWIIVTGQ
jgi:hypothetical protein